MCLSFYWTARCGAGSLDKGTDQSGTDVDVPEHDGARSVTYYGRSEPCASQPTIHVRKNPSISVKNRYAMPQWITAAVNALMVNKIRKKGKCIPINGAFIITSSGRSKYLHLFNCDEDTYTHVTKIGGLHPTTRRNTRTPPAPLPSGGSGNNASIPTAVSCNWRAPTSADAW